MKQTKKPIWLELVNTGVANRFNFEDEDIIEMNWRLTSYPDLYNRIYKHEIEHESGDYKLEDLKHDMKSKTPGLFRFMLKHISSWTQLLPVYYSKRRKSIIYDWSAIASFWLLGATIYMTKLLLDIIL